MKLTTTDMIYLPSESGEGVYVDPVDYAIRANANLGIKETGKSYAATWFAEQLMKRGIPIVAISPSSGRVWRYLKVGRPGFEGFPVVVVGDNADIPLSKDTAADIMRAAMRERISIVFDVFSKRLTKSDFRKIVTQVAHVLLFENEEYGLRHLFLEECGDLVPQRIYDTVTYSAVEQLVRVGGNSSVGVTMINPRAEGINKEVLELCEGMVLFKQTGRNSIMNLDKWLQKVDVNNRNEIITHLATLRKGQCWFWETSARPPVLIQIPEKDTVHPDRRKLSGSILAVQETVDVSDFVARLNLALETRKPEEDHRTTRKTLGETGESGTAFTKRIESLNHELSQVRKELENEKKNRQAILERLESVKNLLQPQYDQMKLIFKDLGEIDHSTTVTDPGKYSHWMDKLTGYQKDMLQAFVQHKRLSPERLGLILGRSTKNNETFGRYLRYLVGVGLLVKEGDEYVLQDIG